MTSAVARQIARDPAIHGRKALTQALAVLIRDIDTAEARLDEDRRLRETGERT